MFGQGESIGNLRAQGVGHVLDKPGAYPLVHGNPGSVNSTVFPPRDPSNREPVQRCQHQWPLLRLQACHLLLL